ncbi:MAG: hypothetical protein GF331_24185 [Chitinivibrionales bacterium]|nr:hypothetical protein [Chitinivibrionales bacterium]
MHTRMVLLAAALLACGCANYTTLQTADVLPKGSSEFGIGGSLNKYETQYGTSRDSLRHGARLPALLLWYRRGLTPRLDIGLFGWLPLGFRTELKYQLAGSPGRNGLALSLGATAGYTYVNKEGLALSVIEAHTAVYLGYDISTIVSLYAVPRYIVRCSFDSDRLGFGHALAATGGLVLGRRFPFFVEGTCGYDAAAGEALYSGAVGVGFRSR